MMPGGRDDLSAYRELRHRWVSAYGRLVGIDSSIDFFCFREFDSPKVWDYAYVWPRDAAFTLCTFLRLGYREEADAFRTWLKNRIDESKHQTRPMQTMYGLAGHSDLREAELDHLWGYRDSKPVRLGNGAFGQLQLDIYGEFLDAINLYSKYAHRHFLHSRFMCWVAFDRAIRLAQRRSLSAPSDEWYRQRDLALIRAALCLDRRLSGTPTEPWS